MARGRRTDDDEAIAGYGPEDAAPAPEPVATSVDDALLANASVREREWSKDLDKQHVQQIVDYEAVWLPWLSEQFGEDAGGRIWRDVLPMLKAGRDYSRRERFRPRAVKAA